MDMQKELGKLYVTLDADTSAMARKFAILAKHYQAIADECEREDLKKMRLTTTGITFGERLPSPKTLHGDLVDEAQHVMIKAAKAQVSDSITMSGQQRCEFADIIERIVADIKSGVVRCGQVHETCDIVEGPPENGWKTHETTGWQVVTIAWKQEDPTMAQSDPPDQTDVESRRDA